MKFKVLLLIFIIFLLTGCKDTVSPVITLNGDAFITLEVGSDYIEFGASVTDSDLTVTIEGEVNTDIVGSYTITYNVTDGDGNNVIEVIRTINVVDTTKPVITLKSDAVLIYYEDIELPDFSSLVNVSDNYDTNIAVVVDSSEVNMSEPGKYDVHYNYTDQNGNEADILTVQITVVDCTAPVIVLNGDATITLEVGSDYIELGAVVTDNLDHDLTATIEGEVNPSELGSYTIKYNVTDNIGNNAIEVTRTINIVDTTKPVITLKSEAVVIYNEDIECPDFSTLVNVSDNYDTDITVVVDSSEVIMSEPGIYDVYYNYTDQNGNEADTFTVQITIVDITVPVITLIGDSTIQIYLNDVYSDEGVTISDNVDNGLTPIITGVVDTSTIGTYYITYNVSDSNGNEALEVIRTVMVTKHTPLVETSNIVCTPNTISLDVEIRDSDSVFQSAKALLYNGDTYVSETSLLVGINNISFTSLSISTEYKIIIEITSNIENGEGNVLTEFYVNNLVVSNIQGVINNSVYIDEATINFQNGIVTLDGTEIATGHVVTSSGSHEIIYKDIYMTEIIHFEIFEINAIDNYITLIDDYNIDSDEWELITTTIHTDLYIAPGASVQIQNTTIYGDIYNYGTLLILNANIEGTIYTERTGSSGDLIKEDGMMYMLGTNLYSELIVGEITEFKLIHINNLQTENIIYSEVNGDLYLMGTTIPFYKMYYIDQFNEKVEININEDGKYLTKFNTIGISTLNIILSGPNEEGVSTIYSLEIELPKIPLSQDDINNTGVYTINESEKFIAYSIDDGNTWNVVSETLTEELLLEEGIYQLKLMYSDGYISQSIEVIIDKTDPVVSTTKYNVGDLLEKITAIDESIEGRFGECVVISENYLVVGTKRDDDQGYLSGAVYVYDLTKDSIAEGFERKIIASDGETKDYFGARVSIFGNYLVVGANGDDDKGINSGAIYIYDLTKENTEAGFERKITASDGEAYDYFGTSVAINETYVLVGALYDDVNEIDSGSIYVYDLTKANTDEGFERKITANDGASGDNFGLNIAFDNNYLVVGSYHDDDNGEDSGSIYVFDLSKEETDIGYLRKIIASDGTSNDNFGEGVAIDGNYIVVGAKRDDDVGAVYVYDLTKDNTDVGFERKITVSDGEIFGHFGQHIQIRDNYLLVGVARNNGQIGALYIYDLSKEETEIGYEKKITPPDLAYGDSFGNSVALNENYIVVGAYLDDTKESDSGSIYLFTNVPYYKLNIEDMNDIEIIEITKDGEAYTLPDKLIFKEEGNYLLSVIDQAGNETLFSFEVNFSE